MAIAYLKSYTPASVSKRLNFSTLAQLSDTNLSELDNLKFIRHHIPIDLLLFLF